MSKQPPQIGADEDENTPENDNNLFKNAMQGVKPLTQDKVLLQNPKTPNDPIENQKPLSRHSNPFIQSDNAPFTSPDQQLSFCSTGLQPKSFKRLKKGQLPCVATLDLHGTTIEQAAQKLEQFLHQWQGPESRCVILIHGRGHRSLDNKPVLKQQVNHWLRQDSRILAFHSATMKDGGTGALYVLLRKS